MKRVIICVDDEAIIVLSLKQELRGHFRDRFLYETALSADDALNLINDLKDEGVEELLVISDWLMPGLRGDQFLELVHQRFPSSKAIVITGHADEAGLRRLRETGCLSVVLSKPWRSKDLINAVESCVSGSLA